MQRFAIFSPAAFLCLSLLISAQRLQACLPSDVKPTDIVSVRPDTSSKAIKRITVEDKLNELKARCKKGKLIDASGKVIYFFRMTGCWGNPPADYQEILERQNKELEKLRKRYTVIEMTCNPDGTQLH